MEQSEAQTQFRQCLIGYKSLTHSLFQDPHAWSPRGWWGNWGIEIIPHNPQQCEGNHPCLLSQRQVPRLSCGEDLPHNTLSHKTSKDSDWLTGNGKVHEELEGWSPILRLLWVKTSHQLCREIVLDMPLFHHHPSSQLLNNPNATKEAATSTPNLLASYQTLL